MLPGWFVAVMVKLALPMSKKIFPIASTLIRAVVVAVLGMVIASVPSLAVLAARTIGNVCPPSVESEIFTLATLIGTALLPPRLHVTVCTDPPLYDTAVLGEVTANGP